MPPSGAPPPSPAPPTLDLPGAARKQAAIEAHGHEVPGRRGVYSLITPGMRADLKARLQGLWKEPPGSAPAWHRRPGCALYALLARQWEPTVKMRSQLAPRIGHGGWELALDDREAEL